jgi:hypothetical protein
MAQRTTRSAPAVEFTYDWYRSFLDRIRETGYEFRPFSASVETGDVLLRHDIDLSTEDALTMAVIEAERDVSATYGILFTASLYNPLEREHRNRIRAIESLGHDLVLHFSPHQYWDPEREPDEDQLGERIADERKILDTLAAECDETVSFHRPPSWVLDRPLDRWRNTYAPTYFSDITYHADSGQRWRKAPPTIEDFGEAAQVLVHPGLWGERDEAFEQRVRRSVTNACRRTDRNAHQEYLPVEGPDQ